MYDKLIGASILGGIIAVNVNRINIIHIPIIIMIGVGLAFIILFLRQHFKYIAILTLTIFLCAFGCFIHFYTTEYAENIGVIFHEGLDEALESAQHLAEPDGDIYLLNMPATYPKVLFFNRFPASKYRESVQYTNYPSPFLDVFSFDRYCFYPTDIETGKVYIMRKEEADAWRVAGNYVQDYGSVSIVICQ